MGKYLTSILLGLTLLLPAHTALAETEVTGFASMVGGIVTHGNQFLSDYPNTGLYDKDISFAPDTSFGIQFKTSTNESFEFIIQLLSHGSLDYDIDVDWAYINYSIDSELSLQLGRKRLPLYYYSDFYDLGFAYYWIRPPSDSYTWQISAYNGMSLLYEPDLGKWDTTFNFYLGREDDKENELLSFLADNNLVDESWKNILGFVAEVSDDTFDYRFTVMNSQLSRQSNNVTLSDGVNQLFYGISVNIHADKLIFLSEYNHYQRHADNISVSTYMLSLAYKLNKTTPHITYSQLKQRPILNGGDEHHYTYSLGVRHNLNPSTALKVQYDITTDKGVQSPVVGDGKLLSFGLDITF
ncbi:MAG: porin [Gammaproteobacteria bacterium]|nr:porin [Gammaproteobacteria bacterium]